MSGVAGRNFVLILVLGLVVVTGVFLITDPLPGNRTSLAGISRSFMKILPEDLSEEQAEEIKGLLARFDRQVESGVVVPADRDEVRTEMQKHVRAGSIQRKELNTLMAKVGYYTMRNDPRFQHPDGSGIHPLLEQEQADTTGRGGRKEGL